jgi:hypothetical protein
MRISVLFEFLQDTPPLGAGRFIELAACANRILKKALTNYSLRFFAKRFIQMRE